MRLRRMGFREMRGRAVETLTGRSGFALGAAAQTGGSSLGNLDRIAFRLHGF